MFVSAPAQTSIPTRRSHSTRRRTIVEWLKSAANLIAMGSEFQRMNIWEVFSIVDFRILWSELEFNFYKNHSTNLTTILAMQQSVKRRNQLHSFHHQCSVSMVWIWTRQWAKKLFSSSLKSIQVPQAATQTMDRWRFHSGDNLYRQETAWQVAAVRLKEV